MNWRSRRALALLLVVLSGVSGWIYKVYDRHRDILDFFEDQNDLAWASTYLDKKINFCDAPWKETITKKRGEDEMFTSPSGRYEIKPKGKYSEGAYFSVFDRKTRHATKIVTAPFSTDANFKWTEDERFLIFTTSITKDDWNSAKIFITDVAKGQTMFLGDSAFYECELRNW